MLGWLYVYLTLLGSLTSFAYKFVYSFNTCKCDDDDVNNVLYSEPDILFFYMEAGMCKTIYRGGGGGRRL